MPVYYSTDTSAPTLNGTVGSLIALLDACLVNGYGSKAAAGWSKAFAGINTASYRQGGGSLFYLAVDDTVAQYPKFRGYEVMTDAVTGTGAFPTVAQVATAIFHHKSNTADATARNWMLVASNKFFMLYTGTGEASGVFSLATNPLFIFGDVFSNKTADAYCCMIAGMSSGASGTTAAGTLVVSQSSAVGTHYIARSFTGIGSSVTLGKHQDAAKSNGATRMYGGGATFPDPVTGGLLLSPVWVHENSAGVTRGRIPGLWSPLHAAGLTPGDTLTGTGALAGKSFLLVGIGGAGATCIAAIEVSDTWS